MMCNQQMKLLAPKRHSLCSRGWCCACSSRRNPQHRCNPGRRLPSTPASWLHPAPRRWAARFCNPPAVSGWCRPCCSAPPWPHSHNQWKTTFCGGLESSMIYFVGWKGRKFSSVSWTSQRYRHSLLIFAVREIKAHSFIGLKHQCWGTLVFKGACIGGNMLNQRHADSWSKQCCSGSDQT